MTYLVKQIEEGYNNRLKNRLFGLLCERENGGEWESFLDSIIIELQGIPETSQTIHYKVLMNNVYSLRYLRYEYFRKTIFDCMSLLGKKK